MRALLSLYMYILTLQEQCFQDNHIAGGCLREICVMQNFYLNKSWKIVFQNANHKMGNHCNKQLLGSPGCMEDLVPGSGKP